MRNVIATMYVSLDGVMENPEKWSLPYFDESAAKYQTALLAGSDLLLQGRATYEGFAPFWNEPSEDAYNNRMYEIEKVLVSRSGATGTWHNTVSVTGDPVAAVRELRQREGGSILTYGFGSIAYELLEAELLDEVHVWIHPVLARDADPETDLWFRRGGANVALAPLEVTSLPTGVTILRLAPVTSGD
jgi:dihydrofolate reductase